MQEAASMPETTKHKVLLCVVCFVSCCNLLWRYFIALNEKKLQIVMCVIGSSKEILNARLQAC